MLLKVHSNLNSTPAIIRLLFLLLCFSQFLACAQNESKSPAKEEFDLPVHSTLTPHFARTDHYPIQADTDFPPERMRKNRIRQAVRNVEFHGNKLLSEGFLFDTLGRVRKQWAVAFRNGKPSSDTTGITETRYEGNSSRIREKLYPGHILKYSWSGNKLLSTREYFRESGDLIKEFVFQLDQRDSILSIQRTEGGSTLTLVSVSYDEESGCESELIFRPENSIIDSSRQTVCFDSLGRYQRYEENIIRNGKEETVTEYEFYYDDKGRMLEEKEFRREQLNFHYFHEYPAPGEHILITQSDGKEVERIHSTYAPDGKLLQRRTTVDGLVYMEENTYSSENDSREWKTLRDGEEISKGYRRKDKNGLITETLNERGQKTTYQYKTW